MRWDRKLIRFAAAAVVLIALLAGVLLFFTVHSMNHVTERIAGEAEEGFRSMTARIGERPADVFRVTIARHGKFESQLRYRDFNPAWLCSLEYVPMEFLFEDAEESYSHKVTFRLKTYDTENVYSHRDSWTAYTRYDDSVLMLRDGEIYYIYYQEGSREYYFAAICPPLTEWLDGLRATGDGG